MEGTKYLKLFDTESNYSAYINGSEVYLPNVSLVEETGSVKYNPVPDPSNDYLTFNVLSSGNIVWKDNTTIQYNKNNAGWTDLAKSGTISVVNGDEVKFKGTCTRINQTGFDGTTCSYNVRGNIMSLLGGDNFPTMTSATYSAFNALFIYNNVIDASNLVLPATTVESYAYSRLFYGCTGLTAGPSVLPATTVGSGAYSEMFLGDRNLTAAPEILGTSIQSVACQNMFEGCANLVSVPPILPATTLQANCYSYMFKGCTKITESPILPAETLANYCYRYMFSGCTSLSKITCLATNISASLCTQGWVTNVKPSGTFYKNPSMSSWTRSVDGVPSGWVLTNA